MPNPPGYEGQFQGIMNKKREEALFQTPVFHEFPKAVKLKNGTEVVVHSQKHELDLIAEDNTDKSIPHPAAAEADRLAMALTQANQDAEHQRQIAEKATAEKEDMASQFRTMQDALRAMQDQMAKMGAPMTVGQPLGNTGLTPSKDDIGQAKNPGDTSGHPEIKAPQGAAALGIQKATEHSLDANASKPDGNPAANTAKTPAGSGMLVGLAKGTDTVTNNGANETIAPTKDVVTNKSGLPKTP